MELCRISNLIEKKRNAEALSDEEITDFVKSLCNASQADHIENCQIGAMLMAIFLNGLTDRETRTLTKCMMNSGKVLSWPPEWRHLVVDKHSTGGVGDKISIVLAPALAALGLKVPMISGRSLGHTGGTLDKLESIPGYNVDLSTKDMIKQIEDVGCCIVGQTEDIVPADKILYHCRDLTGTVANKSLITGSIVSKKLAEGVDALVYDVKCGKGSMFCSEAESEELAKMLVSASAPTKCSAFLTSMNSPIGYQIGNSLEILESLESLHGHGPVDLNELVEQLGAELLYLTHQVTDRNGGKRKIANVLKNGEALKKFYDMIIAQGVTENNAHELCYGNPLNILPQSLHLTNIYYTDSSGYVQEIDARSLADFCRNNFSVKESLATGLTIKKHIGDKISTGDCWLEVHHEQEISNQDIENLEQAIKVGTENNGSRTRVQKRITRSDEDVLIVSDVI